MSEPEIWTIKMADHPQDDFVRLSAYKALDLQKAELMVENARLKAEVERLTEKNKFLEQIDSYLQGANEHSFEQRCDELEAEVERLRKAGDAVSLCLEAFWKGKPYDTSTNIECFDAWNAAKEGKPQS